MTFNLFTNVSPAYQSPSQPIFLLSKTFRLNNVDRALHSLSEADSVFGDVLKGMENPVFAEVTENGSDILIYYALLFVISG
jgi:hypothetical protein